MELQFIMYIHIHTHAYIHTYIHTCPFIYYSHDLLLTDEEEKSMFANHDIKIQCLMYFIGSLNIHWILIL